MNYESMEHVATGGLGEVYRAWDPRLQRPVALKFLRWQEPLMVERFQREARAQARVDHANVCRVYEVGDDDGKPFIAMQYIDGQRLDEAAEEMTLEEKLQVLRTVAHAVHHAHGLGLVHRDLKPGNVLVERGDDGAWIPYVVDFGLAQEVEAQGLTRTGEVLGTPAYMAPEQAQGDHRQVDRRTDVYALGAILYELLTGSPPFAGSRGVSLLIKVVEELPTPPRRVSASVPVDLEVIALKCLEKEAHRRYPSAGAFAEDLERFLQGLPVTARPASVSYRLVRLARRHRLASALLLCLVVVVLGGAVKYGIDLGRERAAAVAARSDAEELMEFMLEDLYAGLEPIGRLDLLEQVARQSVAYYDTVSGTEMDDEQRFRRAVAHRALGQVLENQGVFDEAEAELRRARHLLDVLLVVPAPRTRWLREAADVDSTLAVLRQYMGDVEGALALLQSASARLEQLPGGDRQERATLQGRLAEIHTNLGWALMERGEYEAALAEVAEAERLARALLQEHPGQLAARNRLSVCDSFRGVILQEMGKIEQAIESFRRARAITDAVIKDEPDNTAWRYEAVLVRGRLGNALELDGRLEPAEDAFSRAAELAAALVEHDPANAGWSRELAVNLGGRARCLRAGGDLAEALLLFERVTDMSRMLAERSPGSASAANDLAWDLMEVGTTLQRMGRRSQAQQRWLEALAIIEPVMTGVDSTYYLDTYAMVLLSLGRCEEARPVVHQLEAEGWADDELRRLAAACNPRTR